MSQEFKRKYNQMLESNPTYADAATEPEARVFEQYYPEEGNTRNVSFVWHDGKRIFMNYSFLVSGEYSPVENTIILTFTTQVFILKGVNLDKLFYNVMHQLSKQITCINDRYNLIGEDEHFVVNEIHLEGNN